MPNTGGSPGTDPSLRKVITSLRHITTQLRPGPRVWRGATWGVSLAAALVWTAMAAHAFGPAGPLSLILGLLGGLLLGGAAGGLLILIDAVLGSIPSGYRWAITGALPLLLLSYLAIPLIFGTLAVVAGIIVASSLVGAGVAALSGGRERLTGWQQGVTFTGLALGGLTLIGGGLLLMTGGFAWAPPVNAGAVSAANVTPLTLSDPSQPGSYAVQTLTYGSGEDRRRPEYRAVGLRTNAVDASALIEGWSGLRRAYWGFGPEALPINGRVWYPEPAQGTAAEDRAPYPLVFFLHGNALMENDSDAGYAYLGELLASRGFIAVSVDQNFLNFSMSADLLFVSPLKDENDVRAWLLLEHVRQWQTWHTTPGTPFYEQVAMDAIGLVGHSRGGEAVAIAAAFNRLPYHPDDATVVFDYDFDIRAVASISPVDGQYRPGDRQLPLGDINYLVLHGAHDMDVVSFAGARQYARLSFSGRKDAFKAALYIYGANHGQFNTEWGRRDLFGPVMQLFNLRTLIPAADQQQIARVALGAFLEAALRDQTGYRALFRDPRTAATWLPDTVILNQYHDSETVLVCDYDEDINLSTTTLPGGTLLGEQLTVWREQVVPLRWETLQTSAVYLGWDHAATEEAPRYRLVLPQKALVLNSESVLRFSLADADETPTPNSDQGHRWTQDERAPLDLTLEVVDEGGNTARLPLSHFSLLQPQLRSRIGKAAFMHALPLSEPVFQTFEFRLEDFTAVNSAFDPTALHEVRFAFDRSTAGVVILNDIGFAPVR